MATFTALTTLSHQDQAEALGAALEEHLEPTGVGVFELEDGSGDWEVGGYFAEKPDEARLAVLSALHGARPFAVSRVEDRDWVAQVRRELTPVTVGPFVVHGAHDRDKIGANQLSLEIEAAMAFGTGHHGTTEGCLEALIWLRRRGFALSNIADIGCGTGVLAMAAARLGPCRALATDIDPVAAATARANIAANPRRGHIAAFEATGYRHPRIRAGAPFDLAFMNILARPLKKLAPDAARMLAPGGFAVLSGLLTTQRADVLATYRGWGFTALRRIERRGWATLVLRKKPR